MVLGNKKDVENKAVSNQEFDELQQKYKNVMFYETSARNGFQIEESFRNLITRMVTKGFQFPYQGFKLNNKEQVSR